jgi:magnesium transporter
MTISSPDQDLDTSHPWEPLAEFLEQGNAEATRGMVMELGADDQRRLISRLEPGQREQLVEILGADDAADLLEHLVPEQAAGILEDLEPDYAADVVEELPEAVGGDLLRELESEESDAILDHFEDRGETEDYRQRLAHDPKTAGGLMVSRYLAFRSRENIGAVVQHLGEAGEVFEEQDIQYAYVIDDEGRLVGVLPVRDLVRTPWRRAVSEVMIHSPLSVSVGTPLRELGRMFDERSFLGFPVVDEQGVLCGVVSRGTVRRALSSEQTATFLKLSGIVTGEELRSMPFPGRCFRRLAWLAPNIILNLIAASVIAAFEGTLQEVIALAVFLPIVSDMSGCSGNQAVAVSIRELTLGVIRPSDFLRVALKESSVGIVNGIVLGILLGTAAFLWKGNIVLGLVVAAALSLNTVLSVLLGGLVPLALKRTGVDPALASGPILTTCTDMCGFFLVLSLASATLAHLA